jgi:hypothetical protein
MTEAELELTTSLIHAGDPDDARLWDPDWHPGVLGQPLSDPEIEERILATLPAFTPQDFATAYMHAALDKAVYAFETSFSQSWSKWSKVVARFGWRRVKGGVEPNELPWSLPTVIEAIEEVMIEIPRRFRKLPEPPNRKYRESDWALEKDLWEDIKPTISALIAKSNQWAGAKQSN